MIFDDDVGIKKRQVFLGNSRFGLARIDSGKIMDGISMKRKKYCTTTMCRVCTVIYCISIIYIYIFTLPIYFLFTVHVQYVLFIIHVIYNLWYIICIL